MKDNFSQNADLYKQYRPEYPKELLDYIVKQVPVHANVWDCGTGNGQLAKELCKSFVKVYATDLITVGQAVHWFDFDKFYAEVNRTLKSNGVIAILGYGKLQIDQEIDPIIDRLYFDILGKYWDKERRYIDENYQTIPFPFDEIKCPVFSNTYNWTLEQLIGYLETWSALSHYKKQNNKNPMEQVKQELRKNWTGNIKKKINFPVLTRIGNKA